MPLAISTVSLAGGTRGIAYNQTLTSAGGTGATGWEILEGRLPHGLALTAATGNIAGTPTTAGTFAFIVRVYDSTGANITKELSIAVNAGSAAALPTPFNQNNRFHTFYDKPVKDWEKVTSKHEYQDGGKSFNSSNDDAPQYFEWEFRGLSAAEAAVFDAHFNSARGELFDFPFTDKDGTFYDTGTRYLKYDGSHADHKSNMKWRRVTLVRYPS